MNNSEKGDTEQLYRYYCKYRRDFSSERKNSIRNYHSSTVFQLYVEYLSEYRIGLCSAGLFSPFEATERFRRMGIADFELMSVLSCRYKIAVGYFV